MTVIVFNGKPRTNQELTPIWRQVCDPDRLQTTGGALFQASFADDQLHFGILPGFINGQRQYHYTIPLPASDDVKLIGMITPNATLEMFPELPKKPDQQPYPPDLHALAQLLKRFADELIKTGFPPQMPLAPTCRELLRLEGIFTTDWIPQTIQAMAQPYVGCGT